MPAGVLRRFRRSGLLRALMWTAAGDAAARVGMLLVTIVAARALDPGEFGLYLGFSAVVLLAASLWDLGVGTVLTREVAAGRVAPGKALPRLVSLRVRTFPLWLLTFAMGTFILTRNEPADAGTILAFAGVSLVFGTHSLAVAALRGLLQFRAASLSVAGGRWLTAVTSAVALWAAPESEAFMWLGASFLAGEAFTLVLATAALIRTKGSGVQVDGGVARPAEALTLRSAAPFAANGILAMVYNRLDIVIVAALASSAAMTEYAPASRIQDVLYAIPGTVGAVAFPLMSRAWPGAGGPERVRRLVVQTVVLGLAVALPVAVVVFVFAPDLLRLVLGPEYVQAATPTRILVWFLPLAVIQAPLLALLAAMGRGTDTTRVLFGTFLIAMASHMALDPWAGASGAAVASLTRDIGAVAVVALLVRRQARVLSDARVSGADHVMLPPAMQTRAVDEATYV